MGAKGTIAESTTKAGKALDVYDGPWTANELIHLLKRTMFGVRQQDVAYFLGKSLQQTVDELLHPQPFTPSSLPLNDFDQVNMSGIALGKTWVDAPYREDDDGLRIQSFRKWTMGIFLQQDRSIREKMLLCWHNHFATQTNIGHAELIWEHHMMLRNNALGNFKTLVKRVTLDSHMLRYLNGDQNSRLAPNENYARELQELFCIGKGHANNYSEEDVRQAARILTGWKIDYKTRKSYFDAAAHDTGDKQFSAFYGHAVIKGVEGANGGENELEALLDMLFNNEQTALFICRKLYRWFVYYLIDEKTEQEVIKPLAAVFRKHHYEIRPVLQTLLLSRHFFDRKNSGSMVKSPLDFCIGLHRELEVDPAPEASFSANYSMYSFLVDFCADMGQIYGDPPNVAGWPAYYQAPGFYRMWINSSTYPKRNEFASTMVKYGYNRENFFFVADTLRLVAALKNPSDPNSLIRELLQLLYRVPVSDNSIQALKKEVLLSGQSQDHYWTEAWNDYLNDQLNEQKRAVVLTRVQNLVSFIINSPEYQLA